MHIFQDDLDIFLQLAQKLELEGLTGYQENNGNPILKNDTPLLEEEALDESTLVPSNLKIKENIISDKISTFEELELKLRQNVKKIDNGTKCMICGKVFRKKLMLLGILK